MGQFVFKLPDVGEGTAEAEIVAWHVRPGDVIKEDAPLVDVMTDKATVEMTSPVAGKVISIHGEPGDMAPVGGPIAVFEVDGAGEEPAAPAPKQEVKPAPPPPPAAPKSNGAAQSAPPKVAVPMAAAPPQAKPRIKAQSGAVWSEEETQAAIGQPKSQAVAKPGPRDATARRAHPLDRQLFPSADVSVASRAQPASTSLRRSRSTYCERAQAHIPRGWSRLRASCTLRGR